MGGKGGNSEGGTGGGGGGFGGAILNDGGNLRVVNDTFCQWTGHRREDLIGRRKLQELLTMGGRIFHQTHWAPLLQMQGK